MTKKKKSNSWVYSKNDNVLSYSFAHHYDLSLHETLFSFTRWLNGGAHGRAIS